MPSPKSISLTTIKHLDLDPKTPESSISLQDSKLEIYQSLKGPAMPINNLATTATTITTTTPTIKQEISLKRTISESVCDLEPRKRANISMEALTNSSPLTKLPQDELGQLCQKHIYNEQQVVLDNKSISFERINSCSVLKNLCYMHHTEE
ncbi:hypothetical protein BD770DRAFT_382677 [Pilaira anomala]|nr:hypothetical protein BD770DRAFT_382677 [Pilaira anomala]